MSHGMTKAQRLQAMERLYFQYALSDLEMAQRLGVNRSTVNRDRHILELEVPFTREPGGRFRIDRTRYLSQIRLNVNEALSLYLAARRASLQSSLSAKHMAGALEKLALALRQPMTSRLVQSAQRLLSKGSQAERDLIQETITRAWVESIPVRIDYLSLSGTVPQEHVVKPYLIEPSPWNMSVYLIGESDRHEGMTVYKLERIQSATLLTGHFSIPEDFDNGKLLRYAWGIWFVGREPVKVQLRFAPGRATRRVLESRWHPTESILELEDGGCIWQAEVTAWEEMLPWVRGWGADVEVLQPDELRQALREEAMRLARLYGASEG